MQIKKRYMKEEYGSNSHLFHDVHNTHYIYTVVNINVNLITVSSH